MLAALTAVSFAYVGPLNAPIVQQHARAARPLMGGEKKVISFENFDNDELFEVREVDKGVPPVFLLSGLEKLKAATFISETGVLTLAEENGVFTKLEELGAFSLAEKALPLIEKLRLLSFFESCLNIPNGYLFTGAITLLTFPLNLLMLQG